MIKKMHRWPSDGKLHPVGMKHDGSKGTGIRKGNSKYKEGK